MFPPSPNQMQAGGPPAAPPEAPTLSAFPTSGSGGGPSPAGRMEAIPKLIYGISQLLDTLARAVPGASEDVDQAKSIIRGVLTKALQGGTGGNSSPMPGGDPSSVPQP